MLHSTMKEDAASKGAFANRTDSVTDEARKTVRIGSQRSGRRNIGIFQEEMFMTTFNSGLFPQNKGQLKENYK